MRMYCILQFDKFRYLYKHIMHDTQFPLFFDEDDLNSLSLVEENDLIMRS
jgi:hypothetical protein